VNNPPTDITLSNDTVGENEPVGSTVGTFDTTDADPNASFVYSLVDQPGVCNGTDNASFQISGDDLRTNAVFDYETKNSYAICVMTDDENGGTLLKEFKINVLNVSLDQESSYAIQFGNWKGALDSNAYGGGYRSAQKGTLNFKPSTKKFNAIKIVMYRGPDQGRVQILVDGKAAKTVDLYSATPQWNYRVTIDKLALASHTITVKALNKKQGASSGTQIRVDGFIIGKTTYDDSVSNVISFDTWNWSKGKAANGGSYRVANAKSSAFYAFSGTQTNWITAQGPTYGKVALYVDGVLYQSVDLYAKAVKWNYTVSISGLTDGPHTLEVRVLGTKNPKSKGTFVVVDALGMQ
jgi:hypothetical protein